MNKVTRIALCAVAAILLTSPGGASEPIGVGLDADMSSASAQAGEAIRRGIVVAIDEINDAGGVLGRKFELHVRDHRGNPARGIDNIEDLAGIKSVVAVVGGIHTPVAMGELKIIHAKKIIYLGAWAAGTPVVDNGFNPNYVFRVSVRDQFAGGFLIEAGQKLGFRRFGLILERTGWGRSNEKAMVAAVQKAGLHISGIEWFNWGVRDMSAAVDRLVASGAETLLLVANPREGAIVVKSVADRPMDKRLPIISHWGITGADFPAMVGPALYQTDLRFLQTFSFLAPPYPGRAKKVFAAYSKKFSEVKSPGDVPSPVGTAHAYDLIQLLARAIRKAGTTERVAVRAAMETLGRYQGLVRDYNPPFTTARHDALDATDFRIARYDKSGRIVPTEMKR